MATPITLINMIIIRLKGGLGNQMFEYAAGRALALKTNSRLLLDATFLNDRTPRRHFTFRSYELGVFDIAPEFTLLSRISFAVRIPLLWPTLSVFSMLAEEVGRIFGRKTIYLENYSQSEKYFSEYAEVIRKDFTFSNPLSAEAEQIAAEIASTESVALHVRRGDYVTDPKTAAYHGFVGAGDYYARAVTVIEEKVRDPHLFVFSDDIAWCRENLKIAHPTTYVATGVHDLHLMSLCKHNIIANSSFSWWAAWLNKNPDKIVIAPEEWSLGGKSDDVLPKNWVRL